MAAVGSNVYMLYKETTNNLDFPLLFKRSTDGGASFGNATKLADSVDFIPRIKASFNNVYVLWHSFNPVGTFFVRSTDYGASFENPIKLGRNPSDTVAPEMAIGGKGGVYVAWRETTNISDEIIFRRSIDGGKSFDSPINLSNNPEDSERHKIAVSADGINVYVVWQDKNAQTGLHDISFRRSLNSGKSFDSTINLSNNAGQSRLPIVITASSGSVTNNNVYVAWVDIMPSENDEVLFRRSTDGGSSFGNTINLSNDPPVSGTPAAAAYGDNHFYIAWVSLHGPDSEILYKRSTSGGSSFGNTIKVGNDVGSGYVSGLDVSSNNNVHILWKDDTPGNEDFFFRKSGPAGANFGCTLNLSNSAGDDLGLSFAVPKGGNNVFTAWYQWSTSNLYDIYFRTSQPP